VGLLGTDGCGENVGVQDLSKLSVCVCVSACVCVCVCQGRSVRGLGGCRRWGYCESSTSPSGGRRALRYPVVAPVRCRCLQ
jgi:hypothetical protein